MDCSDAAKMLIDQMKQHPEEFRGYAGKFTNLLDMARDAVQGTLRNIQMSKRDAEAILAAAETHLYEVWLAEDVLTRIMNPKEEEQPMKATFAHRAVGKSVLGQMTGANISNSIYSPSNTVSNTVSNTSTSQYIEQAYQMEQAKYRMELEKLRHQENEYALRNTKPFKPFI
jgi:hypothetical protein